MSDRSIPVVSSGPLSADDAHRLVVDIEHLGVDAGHIHVRATPPSGPSEVGRQDARTISRPVSRVALWSVLGITVGLATAYVVATAFDLRMAPALVVGAILGSALGIPALYIGLPLNPEVYDADAGELAVVEVATGELDAGTVADVERLVRSAQPARTG